MATLAGALQMGGVVHRDAVCCYDVGHGHTPMIKQPPRGLLQKTQTTKFPDLAVVAPARPFGRFVPGKGGLAQGRSQTERRNQTRVPGVFISYHGACRRLPLL